MKTYLAEDHPRRTTRSARELLFLLNSLGWHRKGVLLLTASETDGGVDLPDLLPGPDDPPLSVLFCGVNAPKLTVATGLHFARPGNRFWPTLHGAGFTPRVLAPTEQRELAAHGYGITKLVARSTPRADELSAAELAAGIPRLAHLATRTNPGWIGFLGVTAFRIAFGLPKAVFGPQDLRIAEARVWVLPNPSGLNRRWTLPALVAEYSRLRMAADAAR
jgi:TDG/mug DNA glycosylase family protein